MKNSSKKGFTLVELAVVMVIISIILAIAVPLYSNYWKLAEFQKNESYAKTVYLAAESKLTYYRSSGQWEQFQKKVKEQGIQDKSGALSSGIYTITLDAGTYGTTDKKNNALLELIDDYTYDKGVFQGAIALEIDTDSGEVYSAFYATKCKGLIYGENDSNGYLTMNQRDAESRKQRLLGYYSAEDTVNVVSLNSKKLRITTISLENSEKLSLNWSSNLGDALDVSYEIALYQKNGEKKLFRMVISPYDLRKMGWSAASTGTEGFAGIRLKDENDQETGNWEFPLAYADNKYVLVLDAMMSAQVQAVLDSKTEDAKTDYEKVLSTGIRRLAAVAPVLENDCQIYATVKAISYAGGDPTNPVMQEYKDSDVTVSNTANTLYADESEQGNVKIAAFRHLSNMRYYNDQSSAVFTLISKNMDWASLGTGVYDLTAISGGLTGQNGAAIQKLAWRENSRESTVDFPSIPELAKNHTLQGQGKNTAISNLCLGEDSVADDQTIEQLNSLQVRKADYLGLFCKIKGTVSAITFQNPELTFGQGNKGGQYAFLKGIGILAGYNEGTLSDLSILGADTKVLVSLEKTGAAVSNHANVAAVGGIAGIFALEQSGITALSEGNLKNLTMTGTMKVQLPILQGRGNGLRGVGGIAGYAVLENDSSNAKISGCINHADISANCFTGGIVGTLRGNYDDTKGETEEQQKAQANMLACSNDGLILCTTKDGKYFGGIAGYGENALIYDASSASGQSGTAFRYEKKEELLRGQYVGGIIGYGKSTLLTNCSTQSGGYVLGSDYVGGIAGGLEGLEHAIRAHGGVSVTTNRNYVIGNSYVGGIVGDNESGVTLKDCINNGVAVGYDKYVGGIVGYNDQGAIIQDCASYLSDYDSSIYHTIVDDWKANADYAGGIAGYNDGEVLFHADSEKITVKSVSSIVAGKDCVGGVVGFNDVNGNLDVAYTLIGGRIYASGSCAGGAVGFNASVKLLTESNLRIRPRSVTGTYFVGGCIGANVVAPDKDITISQLCTDNILGEIRADAFCGGVIGYHTTYHATRLTNGTKVLGQEKELLPTIRDRIPQYGKEENINSHKVTITTANNVPIYANTYVGGIIGYCEKNSVTIVKNCVNKGNISLNSKKDSAVNLGAFAKQEVSQGSSLSEEAKKLSMHFAGGILGVSLKNHTVDSCTNTGSISGFQGTGGVVGLNDGLVTRCNLTENFGNAALDYVGGIVGLNTKEVSDCSTTTGKTLSGNNHVGGIAGWNLNDGIIQNNTSYINITGHGNNIGGITGRNSGTIKIKENSVSGTITSTQGRNVGGITGSNEITGKVTLPDGSAGEIVAVTPNARITGYENVGGIAGIHENSKVPLGTEKNGVSLVSKAGLVRAIHDNVGGIVGKTAGDIQNTVNRAVRVTADAGRAGGITALNGEGHTIAQCSNYGNVSSSSGNAGGITAENAGTIQSCTVKSNGTASLTIYSLGVTDSGAICAVNTGRITDSKPEGNVVLSGSAKNYGGITGRNSGIVEKSTIKAMPRIECLNTALVVGTAVGQNEGTISRITANVTIHEFSGYCYLGGIAGANGREAEDREEMPSIENCSFAGSMTEKKNTSVAGNCYGGITGINYGKLSGNTVEQLTMTIQGIYTANSSSTAQQKEAESTHAGGITGKNEVTGTITNCYLKDNENTVLTADTGMLGGVAGFNKGTILLSGSEKTADIMEAVNAQTTVDSLHEEAKKQGFTKDQDHLVAWSDNAEIETMSYTDNTKVSGGKLKLIVTSNGNVGGITAFNGTKGDIDRCVSGDWFLANKSQAIGVGTGGIIGMNESEKDLSFLINGAFVGRQLKSNDTNRFAGGIIGNQNNSTTSDWKISQCINYGFIYCYKSHYSGGIMGQWTGGGGTIENCRNYGDLQTTYQKAWVGASGGIVAQLYHAFEDHEYNIISCENYGNIYRKAGSSQEGANDSAGILGNITNYWAQSAEEAQQYTVRILDCLNAPEVEIYSSSMASGIFGFLSCDNADGEPIRKSTCNVKIEIERCRNFAEKLFGDQFVGGIFGSRYSTTGWSNLILKDCYSTNLGYESYNKVNNPIYSNGTQSGNGSPAYMASDEARKNNLYFDATNTAGYYGENFRAGIKTENGFTPGNNYTKTLTDKYITWGTYQDYVRVMQGVDGRYYFLQFYSKSLTLNSQDCYIDLTDDTLKLRQSEQVIGQLLFFTETEKYPNHDNMYYIVTETQDNEVMKNSRESYRRLEGIFQNEAGENQLKPPKEVSARIENGRIQVDLTPAELSKSVAADPFKYEIVVTDGNHRVVKEFYEESGSFEIPEGMSGTLQVSARAVSMFADVLPSKECQANVQQEKEILPAPDIRAELVIHHFGGGYRDYRYRYSLNNPEAYEDYPGWKVKVSLKGYTQSATLTKENPEGIIDINFGDSGLKKRYSDDNFYQIVARATSDGDYQDSAQISTSAYLPYYRASIPLIDDQKANLNVDNSATPGIAITGDTLEELSVNVTLDNSRSTLIKSVQPIYRVELLGTWKGQNNVVLAKTEVMAVSGGAATASLTGLPEYFREATDLHVRIWFAQSGLGPVYTYHDSLVSDPSDNVEIKELLSVDEDGSETWQYTHTTVFEAKNYNWTGDFPAFIYDPGDTVFTWLKAPKLTKEDGANLEPSYDQEGRMQYTFSWDQEQTADPDARYRIEMTGIDAEGKEVTIDTGSYTGGRSYTIDGDDWNYTNIRLKVTRVGNAAQRQIGLSTTATYQVAQRLERPGQPSVENINENELDYRVSWTKILDETYCSGYQIYLRPYEDTSLGAPVLLGDVIPVTEQENGVYTKLVNLEAYAGKRIVVYVVAKTGNSNVYVDSAAGVTYELEIPGRLSAPVITTWNKSWTHDAAAPVAAVDFEAGNENGLRIGITADVQSIPPGGSAYLLKAYVYDSREEAQAATADNPGDYRYLYPVSYQNEKIPIQMDVSDSMNYYHYMRDLSIDFAGKWIVYYTRISSGNGSVSSEWVKASEEMQLPYAKLTAPQVRSETMERKVHAAVNNVPNMPASLEEWNAVHTTLCWSSIKCAEVYSIELSGTVKDSENSVQNTPISGKLRVIETKEVIDGVLQKTVSVKQYVQRNISEDPQTENLQWIWEDVRRTFEEDGTLIFVPDLYSVAVDSNYLSASGNYYSFSLTLQPELMVQDDGNGGYSYTLKLPDVTGMTAKDGTAIQNERFRITERAVLKANVLENISEGDAPLATISDAYVESNETMIEWQ